MQNVLDIPCQKIVGETFECLVKLRKNNYSFCIKYPSYSTSHNAAEKHNRKLCVSGRSMINVVNVATELGYLHLPKKC